MSVARLAFTVLASLALSASTTLAMSSSSVRVEVTQPAPGNRAVVTSRSYDAHVTLSIEHADGSTTPSGWSTRSDGRPFTFQPGKNLIQGWTDGVLQMREGERALMHVPSHLGYGAAAQGQKGGAWYIPASSNLLFDIEILRASGAAAPVKAEL
jgi:hypothetical protein